MKLDRLCASKIAVVGQAQERDSHSNGETGEKEGAMGPEPSPKPSKANATRSEASGTILSGLMLSPGPTGAAACFHSSAG